MQKIRTAGVLAAAICAILAAADTTADTLRDLVALERQSMDGLSKGNPDPSLAILDPGITYFHIMTEKRLDGLPAVKSLFEAYRGTPLFDRYEIVEPKAQVSGDVAVLTYIFVRHNGNAATRWNATQVYRRTKEGWKVIHSHWSATQPPQQ